MPAGRPAVLTEEERLRRKNLRSQRYYEANKNYWVERRHRLQESGVCLNYCKCPACAAKKLSVPIAQNEGLNVKPVIKIESPL